MPERGSNAERVERALASWRIPELPVELAGASGRQADIASARLVIREKLAESRNGAKMQIAASEWLYDLVRANIKRGRTFELDEVLITRLADCLGYSRLFSTLGKVFGLELGLVEVLIDNAGRYVPHHVSILNLSDGTRRFLDAWYGSKQIDHRRIGALVDGQPGDIDTDGMSGHDVRGLPDGCVQAIVLYVKGNRHLQENQPDEAIRYYSRAVKLYSGNTRAFYNRALAYEMKADLARAEADYARALADEAGLIRVLATTCELEDIIKLDEKRVDERAQEMYLWHKGFKTGAQVGFKEIGLKYGLPASEVERIVSRVDSLV